MNSRILTFLIGMEPLLAATLLADGLMRDGVGARSMSLAGADGTVPGDTIGSMGKNPAGLALLPSSEVSLGFIGGFATGDHSNAAGGGKLDEDFQALPEGALAYRFNEKFSVGISFIPDSLLLADWSYVDAPGGLGGATSYGLQQHRSELVLLRSALGASFSFTPEFAVGASAGFLYNENRLIAPYIFQDLQPSSAVNGAKTLLDLETRGFGYDFQVGAVYSPTTNLQFGVTYRTEAEITTDGDASGDPYAQFAISPGPLAFHYDAEVVNTFPQEVGLGSSYRFASKWRALFQVEWSNWSDAFRTLPVRLRNGSNAGVNGVLGAEFQDNIPLDWKDRFTFRTGLEHTLTENIFLRGGYAYGRSPVPDSTLTPLTAAIPEHMVSAGLGYRAVSWSADFAWQYELPITRDVGTSGLRSGEYSNTSLEVSIHRFALTLAYRF